MSLATRYTLRHDCGSQPRRPSAVSRQSNLKTCPNHLPKAGAKENYPRPSPPMARKPALSTDKLKDLGAEKLAQLVLDEAERNAGFRRQVKAALAGRLGRRP